MLLLKNYHHDRSWSPIIVAYYHYFEDNFGWTHPKYEQEIVPKYEQEIVHSILVKGMGITGGMLRLSTIVVAVAAASNETTMYHYSLFVDPKIAHTQQILWMWSDWYACLKASTVYHTFSDFPASAGHWNELPQPAQAQTQAHKRRPQRQTSRVIHGYTIIMRQLDLAVEWWQQPLQQRHQGSASSSSTTTTTARLVDRTASELMHYPR